MAFYYSDAQEIAEAATDAGLATAKALLERKGQTLHPELERDVRAALMQFLTSSLVICLEVVKDSNPGSN